MMKLLRSLPSLVAAVGCVALITGAALAQRPPRIVKDPAQVRADNHASALMDQIEKKLNEAPDDRKFGMSRLITLYVLKVHGARGKEIFNWELPGTPPGYRAEIHTHGLFDKDGKPHRVVRGSQRASKEEGRITGPKSQSAHPDLDKTAAAAAGSVWRSGRKQAWTNLRLGDRPVRVLARAIYAKESCLNCHQGSKVGSPIGIATVTLIPPVKASPTRPPSGR